MTRDHTDAELARLRQFRRDLHQIPELDDDLPLTMAYIRDVLASLGDNCEVYEPCMSTICAWFDRGSAHATAIRTDMDALPVLETTAAPYASRLAGRMHACGHDGHMAMALALAEWMAQHPTELSRSVLIVFQPAEETTGGARRVCESGIFDQLGVDRIFGFHLWPDLPFGRMASRPGALLAASNEVDVTFGGKGAHIARWQEGHDALAAIARFIQLVYERMETIVTAEPVLLRFGRLESGTVRNAVASDAAAHGSLRSFLEDDRAHAAELIRQSATESAHAYGCTADVHLSEGYPAVTNDPGLFAFAQQRLNGLRQLEQPLLIAEDFAWYQRRLPGLFMLLGTGTGIPLHSSDWDFDESVLGIGLDAYRSIVTAPEDPPAVWRR